MRKTREIHDVSKAELIGIIKILTRELGVMSELEYPGEWFMRLWPEAIVGLTAARDILEVFDEACPGAAQNMISGCRERFEEE